MRLLGSTLLTGISKLFEDFKETEEKIGPISQKITHFRKALYYLTTSIDIWGEDFYQNFLKKLRDWYPKIDANTSKYGMDKNDPRYSIVTDERFGDRRTRLFLAILSIADVESGKELHLIQSIGETYNIKDIQYKHDFYNDIWYYLAHRRADVDVKYSNVTRIFRDSFEKELSHLVEEDEIENFDSGMLSELGDKFYSLYIPKLFSLVTKIIEGFSSLYKYLFFELLILLIFGLIIPLINFSIIIPYTVVVAKICVVITLLSFTYIVFHLKDFVFNRTKSFINKYV